ncbi:hypothetical protein DVH24_001782 [Malus domestica]|uniref:Uncharacterized protein n=1 Tax=Malus domestica TaxID=3750 RepID=A0A498I7V7_MALDO|nr:hypothetical protein DVH24_001782 [Malus domestica]
MGNAKESIFFEPFYVSAESFIGECIFSYLLLVSLTLCAWSRRLHVYSPNCGSECATAFVVDGALVGGNDGNVSTGDKTAHDATMVVRGSSDCDVYSPNRDGEYDRTFAADGALAGGNNGDACKTET